MKNDIVLSCGMRLEDTVYLPLPLKYDHERVSREIDEDMAPLMFKLANKNIPQTVELNRTKFKITDDETYLKLDQAGLDDSIITKEIRPWYACSLMFHPDLERSQGGSVALRNQGHSGWQWRPESSGLYTRQLIESLPLYDLCGIRVVTLLPGSFASIHRDNNYRKGGKSGNNQNEFWKLHGFISITLNVTDGGQPLRTWDETTDTILDINDPAYLFNDHYYHAVGVVTSKRRQIRISGRPSPNFVDYFGL